MSGDKSTLPPVAVPHPHVEVRADLLRGSPVVRGTKVPVRRLWAWFRKGVTAETLIKRYPALGPAKVLAALAFAFDNQALVDADLARERAELEAADLAAYGEPAQRKFPFESKGAR